MGAGAPEQKGATDGSGGCLKLPWPANAWRLCGRDLAGRRINRVLVRRHVTSGLGGFAAAALSVLEAIALAVHLEDVDVVGEPVEQCAGQPF